MTFAIESKERLPDWTYDQFERDRMNQLTQILERRFLVIEESLIDIQLTNQGTIGGDTFAPLVHTHGITEITDYPADNMTFTNFASDAILEEMSNVAESTPLNNQVLKYSETAFGGSGGWILDDFASAGNSLGSLTDTVISGSPVDGSILVYDVPTARWVDADAATLPYVQTAGDLMSGNLIFGTSVAVAYGDASEVTALWNGADLVTNVVGTGGIRLQVANGEDAIVVTSNGPVTLSDDNIPTFRTGVSTAEVWDGAAWQDVVIDTRTLDINGVANELTVDLAGPLDLSADRVWEIGLADDPTVPGLASITIPTGTTGEAPTAANGMLRWDTDLDTLRFAEGVTPTWRSAVWEGGAFHDGFSDYVANEHVDHSLTITLTGDANEIVVAEGAQDISASRTFNVGIVDDPIFPGSISATIPSGVTGSEPVAVVGMMRYDTTTGKLRVVDGGAWVDAIGGGTVDTVVGTTNEIVVDSSDAANPIVGIADNPILPGIISATIPAGATGSEPAAVVGMLRYDTTTGKLRAVDGGVWVDVIGGVGASALDDLTDVTLTAPATGGVLYKSAGDWIDTDAIVIDPAGQLIFGFNGIGALETVTTGINVIDTTGELPSIDMYGISTTLLAQLIVDGNGTTLTSLRHGSRIFLEAEDAGGTPQTLLTGSPDGAVETYYDGGIRTSADANGFIIRGSTNAAPGGAQTALLTFHTSDGLDELGIIGYSSDNGLIMRNNNLGGEIVLQAQDSGGITRTILNGSPQGTTSLTADSDVHLRVNASEFALVGNANGSVDLRYNNITKFSTSINGGVFSATGSLTLPAGITGEEPTPVNGMIRYDSTTNAFRGVVSGVWGDLGGGGASAFDDLSDVTLTAPATGAILYKSASDWIDTDAVLVDPVGAVILNFNTEVSFETALEGIIVHGDLDNAPTTVSLAQDSKVTLENRSGSTTGIMGHNNAASLDIENHQDNGGIRIGGHNSASIVRYGFRHDFSQVNGRSFMIDGLTDIARSTAVGSGGLQINNTQTGTGFERALTASDILFAPVSDVSTADQVVNNSTTHVTGPAPSMGAGGTNERTMEVDGFMIFTGNTSAVTIKFGLNAAGTIVSQNIFYDVVFSDDTVVAVYDTATGASIVNTVTIPAGEDCHIRVSGSVHIADTQSGGDLQFRWAQNAGVAEDTTLKESSWLKVRGVDH